MTLFLVAKAATEALAVGACPERLCFEVPAKGSQKLHRWPRLSFFVAMLREFPHPYGMAGLSMRIVKNVLNEIKNASEEKNNKQVVLCFL